MDDEEPRVILVPYAFGNGTLRVYMGLGWLDIWDQLAAAGVGTMTTRICVANPKYL